MIKNFTSGIRTVIFVAYLSGLRTNAASIATQFALLSAFTSVGRTVAVIEGWIYRRSNRMGCLFHIDRHCRPALARAIVETSRERVISRVPTNSVLRYMTVVLPSKNPVPRQLYRKTTPAFNLYFLTAILGQRPALRGQMVYDWVTRLAISGQTLTNSANSVRMLFSSTIFVRFPSNLSRRAWPTSDEARL